LSQPEVIQLHESDDAAAIRERLKSAEGKRVLLVVPKGCLGLDGLVDLKLLGRQVVALEKEVALVTRDRGLKELAHSLGFRTFSSVGRGQKANWARSKPLATDGLGLSPRRRLTGTAITAPPVPDTLRLGERVVFAVMFVTMLAFLGVILLVFVPTAIVALEPVSYPVSTTISVEASPDLESVDFITLRVPARVVEIDRHQG
jgi:hypothetical protein